MKSVVHLYIDTSLVQMAKMKRINMSQLFTQTLQALVDDKTDMKDFEVEKDNIQSQIMELQSALAKIEYEKKAKQKEEGNVIKRIVLDGQKGIK